jgi:uncharacterized protein (DUF362 family)
MREPVTVWEGQASYPATPPFHPHADFPELPGGPLSNEPNPAFEGVRECLRLAGLDAERFGRPDWNPLACFIRPGHTVLLKPNWVREKHPRDLHGWRYTVTHGSVIRAVAEYVAIALRGSGRIVVGDAPQTDSDFGAIARVTGASAVAAWFRGRGLDFDLIDFRRERWVERGGVIVERIALPGDPGGYVSFDLGSDSRFVGHQGEGHYYGAFYDEGEVNSHHTGGHHEYLISGTAIAADVFINLAKLKTHKKTGVTLNLKNLVGINGDKNWLPHHTAGHPRIGGDQFPSGSVGRFVERHLGRLARRVAIEMPVVGPWLLARARNIGTAVLGDTEHVVRSGNWHGNDTTWRMALDLNTILMYGGADGSLRSDVAPKTYLSFVDGILAGQGSGPLNPDPVPCGVVAFGSRPADVDATCAWLMGFDPDALPVIAQAYRPSRFPIGDGDWRSVPVVSNRPEWNGALTSIADHDCFDFEPHFGWKGAVERRVR